MLSLDATYNRRVVRATVGELLRLRLPENAEMGNRWALPDPLPEQLRLVMDKTATSDGDSYAAGERRLEFRVVAAGSFALSLVSTRSWESAVSVFEVFLDATETDDEAWLSSTERQARAARERGSV